MFINSATNCGAFVKVFHWNCCWTTWLHGKRNKKRTP